MLTLSLELILLVLANIDDIPTLLHLRVLSRRFDDIIVSHEPLLAAAITSRLPDHYVYATYPPPPSLPLLRYRHALRLAKRAKSVQTILSHSLIAQSMLPGIAQNLYSIGDDLLLFSKCDALPRPISPPRNINDPDGEMFRLISYAMKSVFSTFTAFRWTSMDIATIFLEGPELWARILGSQITEFQLRQELETSRGSIRGIRAIRSIWPCLGFQTLFEIVGIASA